MKLLKRITATLSASVDSAVRQIENHDALVEASITNARHHIAETKVRLARVRKEGGRLSKQLQQLRDDEIRWADRARELATQEMKTDQQAKQKALDCLKRRNTCQQQIVHYTSLAEKQDKLEAEMAEQLNSMQARLDEIKLAQNQMRSRSANAEVQRVVSQLDSQAGDSLDDIFDRWDVKLSAAEMGHISADAYIDTDPLESQFIKQEEQAALDTELEAMLQGEGGINE